MCSGIELENILQSNPLFSLYCWEPNYMLSWYGNNTICNHAIGLNRHAFPPPPTAHLEWANLDWNSGREVVKGQTFWLNPLYSGLPPYVLFTKKNKKPKNEYTKALRSLLMLRLLSPEQIWLKVAGSIGKKTSEVTPTHGVSYNPPLNIALGITTTTGTEGVGLASGSSDNQCPIWLTPSDHPGLHPFSLF